MCVEIYCRIFQKYFIFLILQNIEKIFCVTTPFLRINKSTDISVYSLPALNFQMEPLTVNVYPIQLLIQKVKKYLT